MCERYFLATFLLLLFYYIIIYFNFSQVKTILKSIFTSKKSFTSSGYYFFKNNINFYLQHELLP